MDLSTFSTPRPSRKQWVSPPLSVSRHSDDRPQGKNKGLFSSNSSVSLASLTSRVYSSSSSKKHFPAQPVKDPILQPSDGSATRSGKKILSNNPSVISVYSNERKYNLPSEMGIGNRYERQYKSDVFKESTQSYLFGGRLKTVLGKESQVSGLIQYEYAPSFRDQGVTPKIGLRSE
jgi:hypothetical protein